MELLSTDPGYRLQSKCWDLFRQITPISRPEWHRGHINRTRSLGTEVILASCREWGSLYFIYYYYTLYIILSLNLYHHGGAREEEKESGFLSPVLFNMRNSDSDWFVTGILVIGRKKTRSSIYIQILWLQLSGYLRFLLFNCTDNCYRWVGTLAWGISIVNQLGFVQKSISCLVGHWRCWDDCIILGRL